MAKKDNKGGLNAIKDLSQLGTLLKEANKPGPVTLEPKRPSAVIQLNPEDDVLDSIWTLMSDYKGRTISEIERVFDMHLIPTEDVVTLVRYLHNVGCVLTAGRPENPIYSLKKGVLMPVNNQEQSSFRQTKNRSVSAPVSVWDPEGKVDPAEGLDVVIWKLTRDRKPRTIIEIGELGHTYGFPREVVRNRVISLANNKNWYDRVGKSTVTYAMKKGTPMPKPENAESMVQSGMGIKINSTTTQHSWQHKDRKIDHTNISNNMPAISQSNPVQEEAMQKQSTANEPQTITSAEDLVVHKGDDWDLAIWKIMRDYKQYTAAEVGILLTDFGFNPKSTAARLSILYLRQNWFERLPVPGSRAFKYRLKEDIARPEGHAHNVATGNAKEPLRQNELPNLEVKPQEDTSKVDGRNQAIKTYGESELRTAAQNLTLNNPPASVLKHMTDNIAPVIDSKPKQPANEIMTQTQLTTSPVEAKTAPQLGGGKYLKFVIQIKSISMTVEEGRKLYSRLKESGYGKARSVPVCDTNDALFATTLTIKGTVFPASQVQEIALELEEFGFGEDENFES